ncbi:methyl-accepting chemotaxis protein [Aliiglaciecola sp. CAU 1673]|uniref:methyl-accepting chemotaxis protein n=1 Tax=Aliiglaciecola sp. CAU 1673 TaxID=3032595 RepID=UPI0023DB80A5|nr:methyl-accepting chemotaxis protein [Aliiglaciecola sp. CAU 1673]MDF2177682.1 methyl-accepting chemotaxis protein [Aliiglaciecola sp. CAU 1673]
MKLTKSISFKLILAALLIVTVLVVLFGIYDYTSQKDRLEHRKDVRLSLMSNRLQLSLPTAMWNFEETQMLRILNAEAKSDDVAYLELFNDAGDLVVKSEGEPTGDTLDVKLVYVEGDETTPLGKVTIHIDDTSIKDELDGLAFITVFKGILLDALLVIALYILVNRMVIAPLSELSHALEDIARGEGDLTQRLRIKEENEIGILSSYFNAFVEKIQTLVLSIQDSVGHAFKISQDVHDATAKGRGHIQNQQVETDQVAAAITQMSSASKEIAQNVQLTADSADQVSSDAKRVSTIVHQSIQSISGLSDQLTQAATVINSLETDVEGIVTVLDVIRSIAEQTNLLALNAAIEAARAGDQGRGFAVVADEVRALASRTQDSTAQIQKTIEKLQSGAKSAVQVMQDSQAKSKDSVENAKTSGNSINSILESTNQITGMATQIATAVEQQSTVAEELSQNVNRIVAAGHDSMEQLELMTEHSQKMRQTSEQLSSLARQFKA